MEPITYTQSHCVGDDVYSMQFRLSISPAYIYVYFHMHVNLKSVVAWLPNYDKVACLYDSAKCNVFVMLS